MTGRAVLLLALAVVAAGALLLQIGWRDDARAPDMSGVLTGRREAAHRHAIAATARTRRQRTVTHHSARIEDIEPGDSPRPSRLRIAALGVAAPVVALGVASNGEMDVPADADTVAWCQYGPSPGASGSAVLAAHVDYDGREGVFFGLTDLRVGDSVVVEFAERRPRTFVVRRRASIAKRALPVDELFSRAGPPTLTLITCGGTFDPAARSYRDNVVVLAVPDSASG